MTKSFFIRFISIIFFPFLFIGEIKSQYVEEEEIEIASFKENFVSLNFGLSNPSGDYGDQDLSNYYSGLAKTGYNISLIYGMHIWQNTGVMIMGNYATHEYNLDPISSELNRTFPLARYQLRSGNYHISSLMAGIYYTIKMKNGFLDFRFLMGYGTSSIPELYVEIQDSATVYVATQSKAVSASISTNLGIGLRKEILHNFSFSVYFDYFSTNPNFTINIEDNQGAFSIVNYSQPIGMINTTLGIVYRIPFF